MSRLSFTLDTEDKVVVKAVSEMLLSLGGHIPLPLPTEQPIARATRDTVPPENIAGPDTSVNPVIEVPSAPVATGTTLDAEGIPWDERIHSSSKATIANGTWKKKKGLAPEKYEAIKAELIMGLQSNGLAQMQTNEPTATPKVDPIEVPSAPAVEVPSAPAVEGAVTNFKDLMAYVSTHNCLPRLTEIAKELGHESFMVFKHQPDLIPYAMAELT